MIRQRISLDNFDIDGFEGHFGYLAVLSVLGFLGAGKRDGCQEQIVWQR